MRTLAILISLLCAGSAVAQPNPAQAEAMFRRGKDLMAAGKIAEACAAFDASQKLDPTVSTRMNQANCREKNNQLATAWGLFLDAERQTRAATDAASKQLHKVAVERAAKLEPRLSSLRIQVTPDRKLPGLEIRRDTEVVDPGTWNTALPMDAGTYKIIARATGHPEWSTTVTIAVEKDLKVIEIPNLAKPKPDPVPVPQPQPQPIVPQPQPQPQPIVTQPQPIVTQPQPIVTQPQPIVTQPQPQPIDGPPPSSFTTRRKIAIGVGVVGLGALVFGIVRGTQALDKKSLAESLCPDPMEPCSDADSATALSREGNDLALQANIGFGVGAALAIGAGVLWLTGAPEKRGVALRARVINGGPGIAVVGRF